MALRFITRKNCAHMLHDVNIPTLENHMYRKSLLSLSNRSYKPGIIISQLYKFTHLKSLPSNFRADVKRTVLAGMLSPIEKVSVAKRA